MYEQFRESESRNSNPANQQNDGPEIGTIALGREEITLGLYAPYG